MTVRQYLHDFEQRWNCIVSYSKIESVSAFRNRVVQTIRPIIYSLITPDIDDHYLLIIGDANRSPLHNNSEDPFADDEYWHDARIWVDLFSSDSITDLIFIMQTLMWLLEHDETIANSTIEEMADAMQRAIDYSPHVDIRIGVSGRSVILYPAGAQLLDSEVINQDLVWMDEFPSVVKHFEEALRIYLIPVASNATLFASTAVASRFG